MKHLITGSILVSLISSLALISCGKAASTKINDIGGSAADVSKANSLAMTFVKIPAGTFMMGSPDNESPKALSCRQPR